MIFDNARGRAQEFFGQLFSNHASTHLSTMIAQPPSDVDSFIETTFCRNSFPELVRAAEGVPRDAINIAALAAQHAHAEPIGLLDVRRAARDWYLRDKQAAINANKPARQTLRLLIDEVVGRRHSRTFLLDQLASARQETIDELYDARLLHVLRHGIVDPKNPGTLYNGFAIDTVAMSACSWTATSAPDPAIAADGWTHRRASRWTNSVSPKKPSSWPSSSMTVSPATRVYQE